MKKIVLIAFLLAAYLGNAQAFSGKDDKKLFIGANLQENATGITIGLDYGIGENISLGISGAYALNLTNGLTADFVDRFDLKGRFNANLGNVLNISDNFDVYPGLSLSLKNFGGHLGFRYLFTSGFGVFAEVGTTFAKYNTDNLTAAEQIHNQFVTNIGAIFNL
ncbi:hypothetical protein N7U66_11455 [Lacinutrix neustonica]|uniref:Outer membrane protein beta-barrel domain-containing protein n=1 Tax=Lacinutrix neustonica TaxID=2980107 RepID=A0A9E8SCC5_9FLAO|nr:DUF6646 family protein [Lacinutrix neustonica]WAC00861.1 hypothetical protein N7U66_11455 [Lacinutrix neustonica]